MDERTKKMLADADHLAAESDAAIERARQWRERQDNDGLVYKKYHNPSLFEPLPQPQSTYMDHASQKAWDDWMRAHLHNRRCFQRQHPQVSLRPRELWLSII